MVPANTESKSSDNNLETILNENRALRRQLSELNARNQTMQTLHVEINRKLQISSASIKAAVSSMLALDFFWDESTQHEFLETINNSVDQISNLVRLVTLAFHSEIGKLELTLEPHSLPEILAAVSDDLSPLISRMEVEARLPEDEKPVLVDYEYLQVALKLLFEGIFQVKNSSEILRVSPIESDTSWNLYIEDIDETVVNHVNNIIDCVEDSMAQEDGLLPETILKIFVAHQLFRLQGIQMKPLKGLNGNSSIQIMLPFYLKPDNKELAS
jgi:light-regulated signal transduction histidine kinase (bacteriophytochrome)